MVVHGDDLTTIGNDENLDWLEKGLAKKFEIKVRGRLGSGTKDAKEVTILNRVVKWTPEGISYEADPKHAQALWELMGVEEGNGCVTPGRREDGEKEDRGGQEMSIHEATKYRAAAARCNYIAQDRADIAVAAKEACRSISAPPQPSLGAA